MLYKLIEAKITRLRAKTAFFILSCFIEQNRPAVQFPSGGAACGSWAAVQKMNDLSTGK